MHGLVEFSPLNNICTRNFLCLQENTFDIYVGGAIILFIVEYIVGIFFDMIRL